MFFFRALGLFFQSYGFFSELWFFFQSFGLICQSYGIFRALGLLCLPPNVTEEVYCFPRCQLISALLGVSFII